MVYFGRGAEGIWRISAEGGGEPENVVSLEGSGYADGPQLLPGTAIDCYDFASGEIDRVAVVGGDVTSLQLSVSPDARWILYTVYEGESDITLVDGFR